MKFKCVKCDCINTYIKCHMCRKYYYVEKEDNNPVMCKLCEDECEQIYIETINKKKKLKLEKEQREIKMKNLPKEYKSLIIDFDGE